jgi:pyruvate dehydrogenase E1 component alpha subunit
MWTAFEDVSALADVYKKARGYDIPAKEVDGMDVLAVYNGMVEAIEHVRAGNGPYFVEAKTYRYRGHGLGDIEKYRTKEEVAQYRKRDPITQLGQYLVQEREVSEQKLHEIQEQVQETLREVLAFALNSPEPELPELWTDIYSKPFPNSMSASKGRS